MSKEKAKNHFLGKSGCRKLNCAQAVAGAFNIPAEEVSSFAGTGGGKAPDGLCGAYYAAHCIISQKCPLKTNALKQEFLDAAGSLKCKEIREKKKFTCLNCVEKAAGFLESFLK